MRWVIKLGGSLIKAPEFRRWLHDCAVPAVVQSVVVTGGGGFADEVRSLQRTLEFGDALAHELAIDAMSLNARVAQALEPSLEPFSEAASLGGRSALWFPSGSTVARQVQVGWHVTADSLAFALAQAVGACCVCLVKSCGADTFRDLDAGQCAAKGVIDAGLPDLMRADPRPVRLLSKAEWGKFLQSRESGCLPGTPLRL